MTFSLYDAVIPTYVQMLGTLIHLLEKAEAHCVEYSLPPTTLINARLAEDMYPFTYQVKSAVLHSIGAIEGVRRGTFSPDRTEPPVSFDELKQRVTDARDALKLLNAEEVDSFVGRDMEFVIGEKRIPYTAENFLLSFSQPDFYFHLTIAYAILRNQGVKVGKLDFMGKTRSKLAAA
ncbi:MULTISPECIES: DUF1993 domain-containing protein [Burkholderia cepacia complex]|uniref:DUF1993 domain-containing protein n=1 Tax=Burkholderia cepacia complex TaxID=87882 RepID=UPI0006660744|nr:MULTISPECIES: DUF1993 domain-containing protein [Burkholderia cepacia complex]HDR8922836.1 DUF1993 domain-containing protein [Burkholderia vietnamiensis]MBU9445238.1 DUF1993 domain-containing protein [Burkholderia multivorans]MCA8222090.1 DUF1993 domain-containing protein [Burkholderia multivorans]UKD17544.1 DUF1993 domain-containing protein [Burkholderia aenigmatica]HDR8980518.1 DUF1993 domain-containing protein [Burkholderia vietnamiensis]